MIYTLAYTSRATDKINEALLNDILQVSRKNNLKNGITGLLTARGEFFMQFLEGEKSAIFECLARIKKDPRHSQINIICEFESTDRIMQDWSMGWVPDVKSAQSLLNLFDTATSKEKVADAATIMNMIRMFTKNSKSLVA